MTTVASRIGRGNAATWEEERSFDCAARRAIVRRAGKNRAAPLRMTEGEGGMTARGGAARLRRRPLQKKDGGGHEVSGPYENGGDPKTHPQKTRMGHPAQQVKGARLRRRPLQRQEKPKNRSEDRPLRERELSATGDQRSGSKRKAEARGRERRPAGEREFEMFFEAALCRTLRSSGQA